MLEAVKVGFAKYMDFSGRATRAEYWWFLLAISIIGVVAGLIDGAMQGYILSVLVSLGLQIPWLSVSVRRLHDIDRSGWYYFIVLIPLVGVIVLLVWMCSKGTDGRNTFGPPSEFVG